MPSGRVALPNWHKFVTSAGSLRIQALHLNSPNSQSYCDSPSSSGTEFRKAGHILQLVHPELVVSKRKFRQSDAVCAVRAKREAEAQNLGFSSRPFVLCG